MREMKESPFGLCWLASLMVCLWNEGVPSFPLSPLVVFAVLREFSMRSFDSCTRVGVVFELLQRPFVVIDAPVLVKFPCGYGATSPASQKPGRKKKEDMARGAKVSK